MEKAKQLAYNTFMATLPYLSKFRKCTDFGREETADSLWRRLPFVSKQYWMARAQ